MNWFEDALIELDINADKFITERQAFWEGQGARFKINRIYAICKKLNPQNLNILDSVAQQLMDKQKEEMKHEQD